MPPETPTDAAAPETGTPTKDREHVEITVALAKTGYIFSMFSNDKLGVYWELLFNSKDGPRVPVEIQAHGAWITFIGDPSVGKPNDELARALLKLNGRVATARAGFNSSDEVIVVSHFQREILTPEQLQHHIDSVLDTALAVREIAGRTSAPVGDSAQAS